MHFEQNLANLCSIQSNCYDAECSCHVPCHLKLKGDLVEIWPLQVLGFNGDGKNKQNDIPWPPDNETRSCDTRLCMEGIIPQRLSGDLWSTRCFNADLWLDEEQKGTCSTEKESAPKSCGAEDPHLCDCCHCQLFRATALPWCLGLFCLPTEMASSIKVIENAPQINQVKSASNLQ